MMLLRCGNHSWEKSNTRTQTLNVIQPNIWRKCEAKPSIAIIALSRISRMRVWRRRMFPGWDERKVIDARVVFRINPGFNISPWDQNNRLNPDFYIAPWDRNNRLDPWNNNCWCNSHVCPHKIILLLAFKLCHMWVCVWWVRQIRSQIQNLVQILCRANVERRFMAYHALYVWACVGLVYISDRNM